MSRKTSRRSKQIPWSLTSSAAAIGLFALSALAVPAMPQPPAIAAHASVDADIKPLAPPDTPRAAKAAAGKVSRIEPMELGALLIEFGRTRLDDVRKSGGGTIGVRGEPGNAQRWLCYTSRPDRQVWLNSSAAVGTVNGVTLIAHLGVEGEPRCPQLPLGLLPIGPIAGVSIGDKRDYVESLLGSSHGAEWVNYQACSKATAPGAPAQCTHIVLRFEKNRVFLIKAMQNPPT
jgi:hypothetical protein